MLFSATFTGFLLLACVSDLRAFRIPNAVPLALLVLFLVKAAASGVAAWPEHIIAFALIFTLGFVAFGLGMIGGGDAKLMAVIGLWLGLKDSPGFLTITAIAGGALAVILLMLRLALDRGPSLATPNGEAPKLGLFSRNAPVPYALPITIAALWLEWT